MSILSNLFLLNEATYTTHYNPSAKKNLRTDKLSEVPFVFHEHDPHSGSPHKDFRFIDPYDKTNLMSFAVPIDFDFKDQKTTLVKTRDHDPRWLTLKSYRLKILDSGTIYFLTSSPYYFKIRIVGKHLRGIYLLFKLSKTKRDDRWILVKHS